MSRFAAFAVLAALLFPAIDSFAGDLLPIAFEQSTITMNGRELKCDLYDILVGDNGSLQRGNLFQITQMHDDREHYGILRGRFSATAELDSITIRWAASDTEKFGHVERARLHLTDQQAFRITYEIGQHDDHSQVGAKLPARIVDYDSLPAWVQSAAWPRIVATLPPQERMLIHRLQAEQIRATSEIIRMDLESCCIIEKRQSQAVSPPAF